ncbi:sigma-70 family RNA polymerase sigma factor [Thalassotalea euphylliae]|uniref:Sigma-70 family RNA polymerase sigma factor n=1 Tax=Thalassotalea euphylliae TaxID=1655234 RepID=A0A3E0TVE3_9GAMM|nr:sigma-70 family RNA polymerase sigma factor [Thalassotalea euphylliae]REL28333.1 sigma-70 family RNA polymerase sigma factor [Thalassotalea euphylliae]
MEQARFAQTLTQHDFELLAHGKQSGFVAAYKIYADDVYSLCFHLVCDEEIATELLHLVFSHLLKQLCSIKLRQDLGPWLEEITLTACRAYFKLAEYAQQAKLEKQVKRKATGALNPNTVQQSTSVAKPTNSLTDSLTNPVLSSEALSQITPSQRAMVYLHAAQNIKQKAVIKKIVLTADANMPAYASFYRAAIRQCRTWLTRVIK